MLWVLLMRSFLPVSIKFISLLLFYNRETGGAIFIFKSRRKKYHPHGLGRGVRRFLYRNLSNGHQLKQASNSFFILLRRVTTAPTGRTPAEVWGWGCSTNFAPLAHQSMSTGPTWETAGMGRWTLTLSETSCVLAWREVQEWKSYLFWKKQTERGLNYTELCFDSKPNHSILSGMRYGFGIHKRREEERKRECILATERKKESERTYNFGIFFFLFLIWWYWKDLSIPGEREADKPLREVRAASCYIFFYKKCHRWAANLSCLPVLLSLPKTSS